MKSKRLLIGLCLVFIILTATACGKKGPPTVTKIDDCRLAAKERRLKDKRNDNDKFQLSNPLTRRRRTSVKSNSNVQWQMEWSNGQRV